MDKTRKFETSRLFLNSYRKFTLKFSHSNFYNFIDNAEQLVNLGTSLTQLQAWKSQVITQLQYQNTVSSGNTDVSNVMNQIISIKNELNSLKQNNGGSTVAKSI